MSDRDNGEEVGHKRSWAGGGDYVSSKRARSSGGGSRTELRLLIRSASAGAIIGKGGSNIRELREKFNASIQIPDSRTAERVVNTSAFGIDDVSKLVGRIVELIHSDHPDARSPEVSLLVHQSQAGTIIGRGGTRIKELRESTRTAIKIFPDCCPNSTDRVCEIRGDIDSIVTCIRNILEMLEEAPPKGPMQPYDPSMSDSGFGLFGGDDEYGGGSMGGGRFGGGPRGGGRMHGSGFEGRGPRGRGGFSNRRGGNFGGGNRGGNFYGGGNDFGSDNFGGGGGSGGGGFSSSNNSRGNFGGSNGGGPETTTKVTIPTNLAGSIIGKGGQRIRQIRADSGAQIKIDEPAAGSEDRVITIIGTQEQIQNAQFLLQQSVRMHAGDKFRY